MRLYAEWTRTDKVYNRCSCMPKWQAWLYAVFTPLCSYVSARYVVRCNTQLISWIHGLGTHGRISPDVISWRQSPTTSLCVLLTCASDKLVKCLDLGGHVIVAQLCLSVKVWWLYIVSCQVRIWADELAGFPWCLTNKGHVVEGFVYAGPEFDREANSLERHRIFGCVCV